MARATLFLLIVVAVGLLVYLLAAPRFRSPAHKANTGVTDAPAPGYQPYAGPETSLPPRSNGGSVDRSPAIDSPESPDVRSHHDLESKRSPLYAWIRDNMQSYLCGWLPSQSDPATFDLYSVHGSEADESASMEELVTPYASKYGFTRVRFFFPNPPSEVTHWRRDSEATPDDQGVWHLYRE